MGSDDIIIPGAANLPFNIELSSVADPKRTLTSNIGRVIIKKLAVRFKGNEILSVDDFNMFLCYQDLWKTTSEKWNAVRQGIISGDRFTAGCMKVQINTMDKNAATAQDTAITNAYGSKFIFPLDLEMLDSMMPYYQLGLGNQLCYEITFHDYDRVIISPGSP